MSAKLAEIEFLFVDGRKEVKELPKGRNLISSIRKIIGAKTGDVVNLRTKPLKVMIVDDTGMIDGKPINEQATRIYHSIYDTPHGIHGDVAIAYDEDFE